MKKVFKWVGIGFLTLIGLSIIVDTSEEESKPASVQEEKEENLDKTEEVEVKPKEEDKEVIEKTKAKDEEDPALSNDAMVEIIIALLEENFGDGAKIDFNEDSKMFLITPTDPNFAIEVSQMMDGKLSMDDWNVMKESFQELSESISNATSFEYSLGLVNPVNSDNVILVVMSGTVIYDAFEDM